MPLSVTLNLPPEIEAKLRTQGAAIHKDVTEAYALELFRRGRLTHQELGSVLALDRFQTDAYLKRHNVYEGSLTSEDLTEQTQVIERVLGPVKS